MLSTVVFLELGVTVVTVRFVRLTHWVRGLAAAALPNCFSLNESNHLQEPEASVVDISKDNFHLVQNNHSYVVV